MAITLLEAADPEAAKKVKDKVDEPEKGVVEDDGPVKGVVGDDVPGEGGAEVKEVVVEARDAEIVGE